MNRHPIFIHYNGSILYIKPFKWITMKAKPTSNITQIALNTLSKLLKAARKSRRISQSELATRLGVNTKTVIALENKIDSVSIATVFEAAHTLGIPLMSHSINSLSRWNILLSEFEALLPSKIHIKKEVDNTFQKAKS